MPYCQTMEPNTPPVSRKIAHVLAMGFAFAPVGFIYGFINTAMPILLAAQHTAVAVMSNVSVIAFLPTSLAFILCPILDVRFTRRTYIVAIALLSAVCLAAAVMEYEHIIVFTALATGACVGAVMYANALGGWQVDVLHSDDFGWLGAWTNIANLGAAGCFGSLSVHIIRVLPLPVAAGLLGAGILLPLALLIWLPEPAKPWRTASETFHSLFRDIFLLLRQRACLLGLAAFLLPCGSFALANLFSGLGRDFNAPESAVANITGIGVAIACSLGTLVGGVLCSRYSRGIVYVLMGMGGALCAIFMMLTPHTLLFFSAGLLAYSFVQGISFTAFTAFLLDLTGKKNPLAATQISVLNAAVNVPILYTAWLDGHVHDRFGLNAMFAVDAGAAIAAGAVLLVLFRKFHIGKGPLTQPDAVIAAS